MSFILKNKWIFMGIALVLVLASIASICFRGFNLDTDFAGGIAVTFDMKKDFSVADIEAKVSEALGANQKASSVTKNIGTNEVEIKFGYDNDLPDEAARSQFATDRVNKIEELLKADFPEIERRNVDVISPSTGQGLAKSAILMSLLACLLILIYVAFRFEIFSGIVAVLCLAHDVLLLMGIYSIMHWAININFIAAVLTVLGYSINNTIVIMDRIRENTRHARKESYAEIADKSVRQTMTRSINTTITTLLTIGMVYILGVASIKDFALPIIIGIFIGFYSSVFVAGSLWATWRDAGVKGKK